MTTALTPMESAVFGVEDNFNQVNAYKLNFKKEATFALQLLKASDFLRSTAQGNPDSLQNALTNIAAIGISLNPATKESYLVPRNRAICLDISAIGLIKLATDSGSIKWAQAEIVKKNDVFKYLGVGQAPIHEVDFFGDRGETVGVYVVAKTADSDFLVTVMSVKECHDIRDRSEAWKAFAAGKTKSCPWSTDEGEMMKKTAIKRASKLWPKSERLDTAVHVLNEHEGIDFKNEKAPAVDAESFLASDPVLEDVIDLKSKMEAAKRSEAELVKYLKGRFPNDPIESLNNLKGAHFVEANKALDKIISNQGNKK